MLRRTLYSRLASRYFASPASKPAPVERLRRAVAEVLEERRLFATVPVFGQGTPYYTGDQPRSVVSVDINKDGNLDFVTADTVSGTVTIRRGRGDGTFRPATMINVGSGAIDVTVADFNKDNHLDFAVALPATDQVGVYLGAGDGATFTLAGAFAAGDLYILPSDAYGTGAKLATGDFDGNGNLDIAVTNPDADTVSVLLGQGNGQFAARVVTSVSPAFTVLGLAAGDFNGDSKTDLAVAAEFEVITLLASSGGSFVVSQFLGQLPDVHFDDAHDIVAADLTGDGRLDLAVVTGDTDGLYILKGAADGTFSRHTVTGTGLDSDRDRGPVALTVADLDGDGARDIAVANLTDNSYIVLINDGTGHFPHSLAREVPVKPDDVEFTIPNPDTLHFPDPYDIAAGDYNNDGKIDLITANQGKSVILLLNKTGDPSVHLPQIDSFEITPTVLPAGGGTLTLEVVASEVNGWINRVRFYTETNGIQGFQDTDNYIGYGDYANGLWTETASVSGLPGTYTVYAVATDSYGQTGVGTGTYTLEAGTVYTIDDVTQDEGNNGTSTMTFTITRHGDVSGTGSVTYETLDGFGAASPFSDFTPIDPTVVTFNAGQTTKTFSVTIFGETVFESNEWFYISLSNAVNGVITDGQATGTIDNDDAPPSQTPPAAPTGLSGAAVSGTQINLNWTDNANNENGIEIQRSAVYNFQNPTNLTVAGSNLTSYNYTGLSPSTWYYFRVRTTNSAGVSAWSNSVKLKTTSGGVITPTMPAAPTGVNATGTATSQITVTWSDTSNNESGFRIRRSTSSDFATFNEYTVGANVTSFTNGGLSQNTTYYYIVQSFNSAGSSSFTTPVSSQTLGSGGTGPLVAPNGLTGVVGQTTVALSWNDNSNNESKWEIQISSVYNFQPGTIVTVTGADLENYTVQNLSPYTWYYFRVRSVNDTHVSAWTSSVKLKTTR